MSKRQYIILGVSLLIFLLIIFQLSTGKKGGLGEEAKKEDNKKYVKVQIVKNDTVDLFVEGYGRVASARNINLTPEVQGVLQQGAVLLKPGQAFSQGQLLFKINNTEAMLALKARKSGFLNLVASVLPDIKIDFPDNTSAWSSFLNNIELSKQLPDLPRFSSNKEKTFLASKNVLSEYFNIKGDEERLKKYSIFAPFSGTIISVNSEVGANVSPGTPIATIIKTVALEVNIPVDPIDASLINIGNEVELTSEGKKSSWIGKVSRIGQTINPNTQSVDVYISIDSDTKQLFNGMYVEAKIFANQVMNADEIPRRAFLNSANVYTVVDSMLIKKKTTILKQNKNSYVVKGLEDGDVVVIEPVPGAVDSLKVAPVIK